MGATWHWGLGALACCRLAGPNLPASAQVLWVPGWDEWLDMGVGHVGGMWHDGMRKDYGVGAKDYGSWGVWMGDQES